MKPWWKRGLPGWFSFGGGGGGLSSVTTNATLTGAGTAISPLGVAGWPVTFFSMGRSVQATGRTAANTTAINGFVLTSSLTFSHIGVSISATDAVNLYDIGIYNAAGTLVANIGAQTIPAAGQVTFLTVQGVLTVAAGLYLFAWTGNANTATLNLDPSQQAWVTNQGYAASVGGALPASITAPAINTANQNVYQMWLF